MSAWWFTLVAISATGLVCVALAAVRAHREVEPTVQAFAELRRALRPVVAELRVDAQRTRARLDGLSRRGATPPQG
ncbi:MAG: hypothetical protein U0V73_09800 [Acidimicrobiia bacterium]